MPDFTVSNVHVHFPNAANLMQFTAALLARIPSKQLKTKVFTTPLLPKIKKCRRQVAERDLRLDNGSFMGNLGYMMQH